jgi:hypothetical protein
VLIASIIMSCERSKNMSDDNVETRMLISRARALGKTLMGVYQTKAGDAPAELLELLDIAEARLERSGYRVEGAPVAPSALRQRPPA